MGIDVQFAMQLVQAGKLVADRQTALMLGRQGLMLKPRYSGKLRRCLGDAGLSQDLGDYAQPDGFAETFFDKIGFPVMQSMDFSAFEGCDLTHDLNEPVPGDLRRRFGVIVDGGTIEHVFNTPQALDNVFHMLDDDGIFISINGLTGWAGHGFYQFSPELVWRYWQDVRRCEVLKCIALPLDPSEQIREAPDTGRTGSRFRGRGMDGRWYLFYIIRKLPGANGAEHITNTSQGDYAVRWNRAGGRATTEEPA